MVLGTEKVGASESLLVVPYILWFSPASVPQCSPTDHKYARVGYLDAVDGPHDR